MPLTTIEELESVITLTEEERSWKDDRVSTLPILISDEVKKHLDEKEIRVQFVPSVKENEDEIGTLDPEEEETHSPLPRLVHRYKNRVAFRVTDKCFSYCRHCFRRRYSGRGNGVYTQEELNNICLYLKEHKEIEEVLLTGGDLFTLSDDKLDNLLSSLKDARHDIIYRLCTRAVFTCPERFTPSLFKIIEKSNYGAPFYLMIQINNKKELTEKCKEVLREFSLLAIPIFNQSVLLKGVNDSLEEQKELSHALLLNRVKPYYLFQGDEVRGTEHLRVSVEDGLKIEKEMRRTLSGLEMPSYTLDLPQGGGKVLLTNNMLLGKKDKAFVFNTYDEEKREYRDKK